MPDLDMEVDATEEAGEESGGEKKKFPLKLIIIIVAALVILGGGGFFGWQFFMASDEKAPQEVAGGEQAGEQAGEKGGEKAGEKGEKAKKGPTVPGTVLDLEPFIVNLADPAGKRYLKLKIAVDAKDDKLRKEIELRMPQIRDSILLLLTSKSYADIAPVAGKIRLRNEILKIINRSIMGVGSVHGVYFTEFVVQ
jgi:flagellar FliL protein